MEARVMNQTPVNRPTPHITLLDYQREIVAASRRFNVVCAGRRIGKTTLGMERIIDAAIAGNPAAWFSPTYKMMLEVWQGITGLLYHHHKRLSVQERRLELQTGGVIEFWSLDTADAVRGRKYARVVIDEAAMVRNLSNAWQAIIRPTLTDLAGDMWMLSTPRGRDFFWEMWQRGQDGKDDYMSWQLPTTTNPLIDPGEIDAARQELPERTYNQEYLAVFVEDGAGVFRRIHEATSAVLQLSAIDGHSYVVGVDWARSSDFTVFAVLDVTEAAIVHIDRFTDINYAVQVGRLKALCERFEPDLVIAEQNAMGGPLVEQLQREGLPVQGFTMTAPAKMRLVDDLALAFERDALRIIPHEVLIAELSAYEAERLPGGLIRYNAPSGQHDDTVVATMLAWSGASYVATSGLISFL
jgi:phage FluMu gp28-like protein